ncbi:MAG: hypothetical protein ACD_65C00106G0001, partial [uncultured bacterium]
MRQYARIVISSGYACFIGCEVVRPNIFFDFAGGWWCYIAVTIAVTIAV